MIMKRLRFLLVLCLLIFQLGTYAQVAIKEDGSPPDDAAILDLQSPNKGLLIPRIDFDNRPVDPAAGLLIYVTTNGPLGDSALYLYNGSGWQKINETGFSIGDQQQGGVVFWIDWTGSHGLVSALTDMWDYAQYGCSGDSIGPEAEHSGLGTGDTNTAAIIAACPTPGIAANLCDTLSLNGYTDWYLPSRDELWEMFLQKDVIGRFSNYLYWSSTEVSSDGAWIVWFDGDGLSGWTSKDSFFLVRCIRKF
jgi:hypothetical protein